MAYLFCNKNECRISGVACDYIVGSVSKLYIYIYNYTVYWCNPMQLCNHTVEYVVYILNSKFHTCTGS